MAFNLFRPFGGGEPQRDARGRLTGIDRYQDVLGRNWKRFLLTGLCTLAGFAPFAAGVAYAILSSSVLVLLPAGILGGAVAGPFTAALYDTVLRALRDAPGSWRHNYARALRQNWRGALAPGALTGLFLAAGAFAGMMLFGWAAVWPSLGTICVYLFSWLLFFAIQVLYWPQLVLFEQKNSVRLRNALLFTLKYSLPVLGAAGLQLVAWLLMVLFAPWTLLLLPVAAVWFIPYAALFVLYDDWEEAFQLEEQIAAQFPDQPVRRD